MGKVPDFRVNGSGQALSVAMSKLRHRDEGLNPASGHAKTILAAPGPLNARRSPQSVLSFYTIGQVAEALGISTRTVRRWIATRALAAHRFDGLVRIAERDLLGFLAVHREG
jgi:excisionase family DNA binding protein